jgi:putative transposase
MIDQIADKDKSMLMFFDEGRFGLRSTTMRMWAEKGKPLTVNVRQGFKNFYGYSAVCPFDGKSYSLVLPKVNTEMMNIFLTGLQESFTGKKIYLVMDGAGWHKSKALKEFENIEILIQPPYSPELNPIEKLWQWLKKECQHNFFYDSIDGLMDAICEEYNKLKTKDYKRICNCSYLSYII